MQLPLQLTTDDGVPRSPELEKLIRRRVDKLERLHSRIIGCRVVIERPHRHAESGNPFRVRIDLTVPPKHELVVEKEPAGGGAPDPLRAQINEAFSAMERQLKELAERQRHEVKTHDETVAFVVRLFEPEGYGFLKTPEGREIYFHRNSVVGGDFDRLEIGTQVRFEEALGRKGPQATTVQIVDAQGVRTAEGEEEAEEVPFGWRP